MQIIFRDNETVLEGSPEELDEFLAAGEMPALLDEKAMDSISKAIDEAFDEAFYVKREHIPATPTRTVQVEGGIR